MNNPFFKTSLLLIWLSCLNLNAFSDEKYVVKYALDDYDHVVVMRLEDRTYRGEVVIPFSITGEKTGKTYYPRIIYKNAFSGCYMSKIDLTYINSIGDFAFEFCPYLEKVSIGRYCEEIGKGVLAGANEAKVNIDMDNIYYDSRNGCNAIIETSTNRLIAGSSKTTIPEGVECLATHSFSGLFLENITIPKSVKEIEKYAFNDFYGYLKEIYVAATEPPTVYDESFWGCDNTGDEVDDNPPYEYVTLYVPKGCIEKYRNNFIWGQFKKIEEYDSTTSIRKIVTNKSDDDRYFDISGHMHETPIRGLNILKQKDGTTKKIIVKQ